MALVELLVNGEPVEGQSHNGVGNISGSVKMYLEKGDVISIRVTPPEDDERVYCGHGSINVERLRAFE